MRARANTKSARRLLAGCTIRTPSSGAESDRSSHLLNGAIALYRRSGYEDAGAFNDEPDAHHRCEKHLS